MPDRAGGPAAAQWHGVGLRLGMVRDRGHNAGRGDRGHMATAKTGGSRPRFDSSTLRFLTELASHNERPWFAANKQRYDDHVATPALAFIDAFTEPLAGPQHHGGPEACRRLVDARLSHTRHTTDSVQDQHRIQFRHERSKDVHAGLLRTSNRRLVPRMHLASEPSALTAIRSLVEQPTAWRRRLCAFRRLARRRPAVRVPEASTDAPHADDLRRKDFIATCGLGDGDVLRPDFAQRTAERFRSARPLMRFLCDALDFQF
jgi:uncharacterized protein (TIGR02453 family)